MPWVSGRRARCRTNDVAWISDAGRNPRFFFGRLPPTALRVPRGTTDPHHPRVIFTSGGTEGNNLVLQGYPWDFIITAATEHTAVYFTAQFLAAQRGVKVIYLRVDGVGAIDLRELEHHLSQQPANHRGLVSLMYVNNEIGTVHDIAAVGALVRRVRSDPTVVDVDDACPPPRVFAHGCRAGRRPCAPGRLRPER